ncbi:MAG TPA: sensor histidine kinase [Flavisolibacter sp.]|jgi:signal transduction histidine kinase|nr:sensor histidine kinase [Flavisolibacter sp.]
MPRLTCSVALLLLVFCFASCRQQERTEREETIYWNNRFADSAHHLLYAHEDSTEAFRFYDSSLKAAATTDLYPYATRFRLISNYYYFFTQDNASTARYIDSALALFHTPALQNRYPRTYVDFLVFGGDIAYRLHQYWKANEYYFKAKMLADALLEPCERTAYHYSIAMVLYRQQNYSQSVHYFKQAYDLQATCSPLTSAKVLQQQEIQSNIGLCHAELKNYDSALVYFDNALQIASQYKDSLGSVVLDKIYGVIYGHKGQIALAKGDLQKAEHLTRKSIELNDRIGYEMDHAQRMKLQLADIYYKRSDLRSLSHLLSALGSTINNRDPKMQLEWMRFKGSYFEKNQHADSALYYFKGYYKLLDSISEEQKELTAADVDRQMREKEQQLQIAMLENNQHITLISLWVTIIFSGMAVSILYLIYQNYRRSKKNLAISLALNEEIQRQKEAREAEAKQQHKLITEAVIQAQESERSLIGLELHDNINQVLTTVKLHNEMLLEGIGDPKVILPRTLHYLQNCINEIRGLSKRLSAPTLGKISLEESVKDLVDSINLTSKVRIHRQITGMEKGALSQDLHIGIYRILQEQLNNVLKHAEASEVKIQLERRENTIRLCITDNGKGFTVHTRKIGIGLMNMRTRAENLSGTFEVKSKPGQGCKVVVVVPCMQPPCNN